MVIAKKRKTEDKHPDSRDTASVQQEPSTEEISDETNHSSSNRVRLSADIEHKAHILIKTYSATIRKPISSIIQDMIYENCRL